MRVLHVITSLRTGGAEKLMVDLLPRLSERGVDVELAVFDGTRTAFMDDLEAAGIRVHKFNVGESVYSPRHIWRLRRLMRGFDIVHTHNTAPQLFAAICRASGRRCRLITTEHGGSNRRRGKSIFRLLDRWMYNRYEHIICISEKAEENLREHLKRSDNRILTINNGVDVARYARAEASAELRAMLPENVRAIIMVAGFRWEKDQPTLIRSLKFLPENFHLFLVGDGVRRAEFETLIAKHGLTDRVHLLGLRTDVAQLLHAADYIVMSSHFEGLSLSSVEGMSVGRPFIASNVDGLREVVADHGILFPHEDAESLARVICNLDANPEKYLRIAERCLARAKKFDISSMADKYAEVYFKISLKK